MGADVPQLEDDMKRNPTTEPGVSASHGSTSIDGQGIPEVDQDERPRVAAVPSVVIGTVVGFDPAGRARVEIDRPERQLIALCATNDVLEPGALVALAFIDGDIERPIIVGRLQAPRTSAPGVQPEVVIEAGQQITLRCGEASLVLTHAGKAILRGEYVSTHSKGVNRIKGGSVQIN
jgi:Domain of unknown function (DUF6484)